jgi:hypothetical protein
VFLTDALHYNGGSCKSCMIDNTHVIVLRGTGREMVPVPTELAVPSFNSALATYDLLKVAKSRIPLFGQI